VDDEGKSYPGTPIEARWCALIDVRILDIARGGT
jgi:hypothetical protein